MTAKETSYLFGLVRSKTKLAKTHAAERAAALMADTETQLATIYDPQDAGWREIVAQAEAVTKAADIEVQRACEAAGIPKRFRPHLHSYWTGRGENTIAARRTELRAVARTRIEALTQRAVVAIEEWSVAAQTRLAAGQLESPEARAFPNELPAAQALMPPLDVAQLELADPEARP